MDLREGQGFDFTEVGGNVTCWVSEAKMGLEAERKWEGAELLPNEVTCERCPRAARGWPPWISAMS